jgi:hypothetical protein
MRSLGWHVPEALRWAWSSLASRDTSLSQRTPSDDGLLRLERCDDRSLELIRLADVPGSHPFSERQPLGLELATALRALALRVSDRRDSRRRCVARCRMFAIDSPHRIAAAPGHMKHAMNPSNITDRSPRIADFQSAPSEAPRPMRKKRLRNPKTHTSIAQKHPDFGASTCSNPSSEPCAEQNHLREKIGEIAKQKIRVQPGSAPYRIASL